MGDRSLVVRIRAEIGDFRRQMAGAAADVKGFGKAVDDVPGRATTSLGRISQAAEKNSAAWAGVGSAVTRTSLVIGAGLGLAAKSAIDWESAWTGVTKTVDGSASQMAALEGQLRGLTKVLPASHSEIAGVAEAAGQLGVSRADIAGFTKTMIELGESTNLSADEAATSLAQISNVMGTMGREGPAGIERLGSTLVALGNAGASTEADIVQMSTRIVGAAKLVGASESDVLALSNAMSSVGIEAQLGGSVVSRILTQINTQVLSSGSKLADFARVAGVSAHDFAAAWKADPVAAFQQVVAGLARVQASGGDTATVLSDLGIKGTENAQVMLRLTGASDLLSDSIKQGRDAWAQNSALADEAGKRNETAASKIAMAKNAAVDAAITFGGALAPAVVAVSKAVGATASAFGSLPGPVQTAIGVVTGVGAAGALAAVGIAKVVTLGKSVSTVFSDIGRSAATGAVKLTTVAREGEVAAGSMGRLGKGASIAGKGLLALAAVGATVAAFQHDIEGIGSERLIAGLRGSGDALAAINAQLHATNEGDAGMFAAGINDLGDALHYAFSAGVGSQIDNTLGSLVGIFGAQNASDIAQASARLKELDAAMAALVSRGSADQAAAMMSAITDEAKRQGISLDELAKRFPQYVEAQAAASNQASQTGASSATAAGGVKTLDAALGDGEKSAKDAQKALDGLVGTLESLGSTLLDQRGSARDFQAAVDAATAAVKDNGRSLDIATDKGRANQSALDDIATATATWAAKSAQAGASQGKVASILEAGRSSFVKAAESMGMSAKEAGRLADKLGLVPKDVSTYFEASGVDAASKQAQGLKDTYDGLPAEMPTTFLAVGTAEAAAAAAGVKAEYDKLPTSMPTTFLTVGTQQAQADAKLTGITYDQVPTSHETNFSTPGSVESRIQSQIVESAIRGIPRSWSSVISTSGADAAAAAAWKVRDAMWSIPRQVHGTIIVDTISHNQTVNERGGLYQGGVRAYAGGGISLATGRPIAREPQILPGGTYAMWAERKTGWEAYISGLPSERDRNLRIWRDAGRLLGVPAWVTELARAQKYAAGGMPGRYVSQAAYDDATRHGVAVDQGWQRRMLRQELDGLEVVMDGYRVGRLTLRAQGARRL